MANLTGPGVTGHRPNGIIPVALAAVKVYKAGAAAVVASTGYGTPLVPSNGNHLFIGLFGETYDNSGGTAGGYFTQVVRNGLGQFAQTGSTITAANIGSPAYFSDDHTVTLSSGTTYAGIIAAVDAAGLVWVDIENAVRQTAVGGTAIASAYKLPAANLGAGNPTTNVSGAAQVAGTLTIPANALVAGNIVRVTGQLVGVTRTASDTALVTLTFGSVTLTLAAAFAHATTNFLTFMTEFTVLTAGGSGTMLAAGIVSGGTVGATLLGVSAGSTALVTTSSMPIALNVTFSASNTSDQIAINDFHAEVIN